MINFLIFSKAATALIFGLMVSVNTTQEVRAANFGLYTYEIINGNEVEITGYSKTAIGTAIIPSSINGMAVTSIRSWAFSSCKLLEGVTIPDTIASISYYSFSSCDSLRTIILPNSVTSIGEGAFLRCYNLREINIPDTVRSIGKSAFYECRSLTGINIPDSITSIGETAFYQCSNLTEISIPDEVTLIGNLAFGYCEKITRVVIGKDINELGEYAFGYCKNLASVYFLGEYASISGRSPFIGVADEIIFYYLSSSSESGFPNNSQLAPDTDADGIADIIDDYPLENNFTDTDGDNDPNITDPDDDNDGVADTEDFYPLDKDRVYGVVTREDGMKIDKDPATPPVSTDVSFNIDAAGKYSGLLRPANGKRIRGYFEEMFVTDSGNFSGILIFATTVYALKGSFDEFGRYLDVLTNENVDSVTLDLQLARTSTGAYKLVGTAQRNGWVLNVEAIKKASSTGDFKGRYTLLVANEGDVSYGPKGHGYAGMWVSDDAEAFMQGRLADGEKWTGRCYITEDGEMPLYSNLFRSRRGELGGMIRFRDLEGVSDCDGEVTWFKPQRFNRTRDLIGSRYMKTGVLAGDNLTKPNIYAVVGWGNDDLGGALEFTHQVSWKKQVRYRFEETDFVSPSSFLGKIVTKYPNTTTAELRMYKSNGKFDVFLNTPNDGTIKIADGIVFQKQDIAAGKVFVKDLTRRSLIIVPSGFQVE